ncbi:zinc ribbon domain-containing protein [Arthrobacter sp. NEB 688]|uniref:zinc ribbon domain-containing protein n=1 Tax=Arthrobacter sp. NEB 688 TaxID=904039 RepID=UPI0015674BD4|nr:zinc ribbon domain-containing protein [Arthrobacter sp. NEB 688]QKE82619.1 hypothetical protein HL663_00700 [Arthrobacter sp. NEB 688]
MSTPGRESPVTCPECGATVHAADRFCALCGTTLPRDHAMPSSPSAADEPTTELPAVASPPPFAPATRPVPAAAPARPETDLDALLPSASAPVAVADPDLDEAPAGPRRGCLGMVALGLVGLLMLAGLLWFFGSDDDGGSQVAAPTVSSSSSASPDDTASPDASSSAAPSDGPTPTERASTAKRCGTVDGATAWSGNEVTSCDFATETAQALMASSADLPTTVTARSPVTKQEYAMRCENTTPVVCRGGTDALVYVDVPN